MNVTIKDIAKAANVSHTTVSRALNDSPLINDVTKRKIRRLAQELNYVPNVSAKSLVSHRSFNIGLFFSTLSRGTSAHFFYDVVREVSRGIKDQYNLIVKGIDEFEGNYRRITPRQFDGVLVMSQSKADDDMVKQLIRQHIPVVLLNRPAAGLPLANIVSDDRIGAYRLVAHLVAQGHKRIAMIEGREGFMSSELRMQGYADAMRDSDLRVDERLLRNGSYDVESGYEAMQHLLGIRPQPTAVFCANDDMAVGAIKAIHEAGLGVPHDISVAGFDDSIFAAYTTPALTTVKRPVEQVSREGLRLLLDLIEDKRRAGGHPSAPPEPVYLEAKLIIRQSVAEPVAPDAEQA